MDDQSCSHCAPPLRQYRSSSTSTSAPWLWVEDFVYRNGLLLGGERVAEEGGRRHYHLDHLGTPRLVTGASGSLMSEHDLLPFGEERTMIGQHLARGFDREEPHRFTGHERDFDTSTPNDSSAYIDYMHARFYVARTGRFLSPDPVLGNLLQPQSWNRYAYVLNNPTNFIDPLGLAERKPGEKIEEGDTCEGTIVEGWCTGETITVEAKAPSIDFGSIWGRVRHETGNLKYLSWSDAPIFREKRDVPCKSYGERFVQSFAETNGLPGLTAPAGLGIITAGKTAQVTGGITPFQWARAGFGGAVLRGTAFTATETGVIMGATTVTNFAFVTVAYEGGVAIGSAINAALTDGCM